MNAKQVTDALQSIATVLELIAGDREFQDLINDPRSHPEIASDLADARHYVAELINKLDAQQQILVTRKFKIWNGRVTRSK